MHIIPACDSGLGMEDGSILDDQITASSERHPKQKYGASNACLNIVSSLTGAWRAQTDDLNQWIQADLGGLRWVSGIVTQGQYRGDAAWVTMFNVSYSANNETWSYVQDNYGQNVRKHNLFYSYSTCLITDILTDRNQSKLKY